MALALVAAEACARAKEPASLLDDRSRPASPDASPDAAAPKSPGTSQDAVADAALPTADASPHSAATAAVGWSEAEACAFPPVFASEGTTAKQCCEPGPDVRVCLETVSQVHHHEVGPHTVRTLTVRRGSSLLHSFPLDRQNHVSMKFRDEIWARLAFRVTSTGLELRVVEGCTGGHGRLRICESAGTYIWDGERLVVK